MQMVERPGCIHLGYAGQGSALPSLGQESLWRSNSLIWGCLLSGRKVVALIKGERFICSGEKPEYWKVVALGRCGS